MPRMAIRMASAAQWAALGPYLQTMLPRYAVQLTQLSGPLCGVLVGPIVGAYSDRNTSCFGRRRPYLVTAAVGSIIYWVLMSYTRELGDAFGDVSLLTVLFYFWTGFMIHLSRAPAMLLISDFAGQHQTVGAALGQGWSVLGAVLVAVYTECFGAAYNSLGWFMGMLSIVMAVSIGAACYVAKESPLEKSMEKQSCCQNVTSAFGSILSAVRTLPKVLVVYCIVLFFIQRDQCRHV
ncbi:Glycoside-Pentoside-Hexuronide (GPH):Cation Symporter Family [Phytophthora infestans T30-4]|uniref:Glycoside-Pentoside-Hexuronide (GPH):Cation Symporter Family n=1 Tax=Phytophthora infestans (strain T30-4) TaxID=403677 RepID=D0MRZ5_PHYIT|nr:Glycoside-Pentoside-Hexuronide (GPH):Cation Symporter Family [Phytophthora infestans T30-4]EEY58264.1 Glycoside-Pentoside-Hexuronide (GPH):Cation Symporter Family [Phytophthora infestans T30-4]|eukprot:XP_002909450.1 Glycoside-Pentoside-Hexuronide (GPH):Cation Symporter Family [Phytophthora infestans T30-4]